MRTPSFKRDGSSLYLEFVSSLYLEFVSSLYLEFVVSGTTFLVMRSSQKSSNVLGVGLSLDKLVWTSKPANEGDENWIEFVDLLAVLGGWLPEEFRSMLNKLRAWYMHWIERQYMADLDRIMDALSPVEIAEGRIAVQGHVPSLAQLLGIMLLKDDGTAWNHIGWQIGGAPEPLGMLELTLQRCSGETPLQQRDRYKAQAEILAFRVQVLELALAAVDPDHPCLSEAAQ